jgi:hypothetical protein
MVNKNINQKEKWEKLKFDWNENDLETYQNKKNYASTK